MIDHDNLEEFRDPQTYDLEDEGYFEDYPLTEQWARALGGQLLDLALGRLMGLQERIDLLRVVLIVLFVKS